MKYLKNPLKLLAMCCGIIIAIAIPLLPILWMVTTSLKPDNEIYSISISLLPKNPTLTHYYNVLTQTSFARFMFNSFTIGILTACLSLFLSTFAGYSLSRFVFRGKDLFETWLLFTQLFPWILAIIPIFTFMHSLGLLNNHLSLVIMYTIGATPFSTLMCRSYFDAVPKEIEEAAMVDGCSRTMAVLRIILPLAAPGLAAVTLFAFVLAFQEFLLAFILIKDVSLATVPLGLYQFIGSHGEVIWGQIMAASTLATIPIVICFMFLQKFIVSGLTLGAVKG